MAFHEILKKSNFNVNGFQTSHVIDYRLSLVQIFKEIKPKSSKDDLLYITLSSLDREGLQRDVVMPLNISETEDLIKKLTELITTYKAK